MILWFSSRLKFYKIRLRDLIREMDSLVDYIILFFVIVRLFMYF